MSLTQAEPEHRFSGAYDPEQYATKAEQPQLQECECGAPFVQTAYRFQKKDYCLNCALDAAGIDRRFIRLW